MTMKKTIYTSISCILLCGLFLNLKAQESVDKYNLLTTPYVERPINLYKGQFSLEPGYGLTVRRLSFDSQGEKLGLKEDGRASVKHDYFLKLSYGILDFLEAGVSVSAKRQGEREQTINYYDGMDFTTINTLKETKGLKDSELWISISSPFKADFFDFALRGGISLPLAGHEPLQPEHSIQNPTGLTYFIDYHYINKNGNGVIVYKPAALVKIRTKKFSLFTYLQYDIPAAEVENIRWESWIENNEFLYKEHNYRSFSGNTMQFFVSMHYQPIGWLNLSIAFDKYSRSGGWTEQYNNIYALPESELSYIEPAFELQISPLIRLHQMVGLPVAGANTDAGFFILTSLSFNMMPL